MQALDPTGAYTDAEVIDALSGRYGTRTMTYRYERLNSANTLIEALTGVVRGSVSNNTLADIKRSARFTLLEGAAFDYGRDRIKPWARLAMPTTGGRLGYVEWPLGVFLTSSPTRALGEAGEVMREVEAYDQLVVLRDDRVTDRYSVASGTAYTTAIAALIAGTAGIVSTSIVPSALTLPAALEWEPGTTKLRILNDMLAAINYGSAWFDESGRLICRPYQSPAERAVEYTYRDGVTGVRRGGAEHELELFEVYNKWIGIVSEGDRPALRSEYTNDNPASPTSTVSRGRIIVDVLTELDAADQSTLNAIVRRKGFEASQVYERVKFSTMAMPMHSDGDVLALSIPGLGLDGKYSEQSWSLDLAAGASMSHTVRRVVSV